MRRLCCGFGISVKKYWRSVAAITKRCGMRSENQKKERNAFARTGQRVIAMKKVYRMEDLDCANCAMKIERDIRAARRKVSQGQLYGAEAHH